VEQGFDVNSRDSDGVTLMHWAAINNRVELIKYFISKGAAADEPGGVLQATPLHWATRYSHYCSARKVCISTRLTMLYIKGKDT
jgi:palmitoyltransferase